MKRKFFGLVAWVILCTIIINWCCRLLSCSDSLLNITAVIIFSVWFVISYETNLFTKKITLKRKKK